MTETLTDQLLDALRDAGMTALREYPAVLKPMPADAFFVTIGMAEIECGMPFFYSGGIALPAVLKLRLRYHVRTDSDASVQAAQADACLQNALLKLHCDVRQCKRGEFRYQKTLDRMEQETLLYISGTLYESTEAMHI